MTYQSKLELLKQHSRGPAQIGPMVLMLSLDSFRPILPHVFLDLNDPKALQAAAFASTRDLPDAYYDEDVIGWHQWWTEVGQNFLEEGIGQLSNVDHNRVLHWLENGDSGNMHFFPHRNFWVDACSWVAVYDQVAQYFSGPELYKIRMFAHAFHQDKIAPSYAEVKETIAETPDTVFDMWYKTKFHIYVVPDVLISQPFTKFGFMRSAHLLKKHLDAYVADGGDPELLERMAIAYAEQLPEPARVHTQKYIDDKESFRIANLWDNRFQEAVK